MHHVTPTAERIAFVCPRFAEGATVGGAETLLKALAQQAVAAGHRVTFLATCAQNHFTWANELPPGPRRIGNLDVRRVAVSDRSGRGRLQVVDDQSWSKLIEYGEHPFTERVIDVELVAIDDLLAAGELAPPTVVKIDVEGAELAVLAGMRETIEHYRPAIICELHDTHAGFLEAMDAHGYRVINLEGTVSMREAGASAHALALPPTDPGD